MSVEKETQASSRGTYTQVNEEDMEEQFVNSRNVKTTTTTMTWQANNKSM